MEKVELLNVIWSEMTVLDDMINWRIAQGIYCLPLCWYSQVTDGLRLSFTRLGNDCHNPAKDKTTERHVGGAKEGVRTLTQDRSVCWMLSGRWLDYVDITKLSKHHFLWLLDFLCLLLNFFLQNLDKFNNISSPNICNILSKFIFLF